MSEKKSLEMAVKIAGGSSELAKKIGCSKRWVNMMLKNGKASDRLALKISVATGVPAHDLAPEIYPKEVIKQVD